MEPFLSIGILSPKILEGVMSGILLAVIFWISGLIMSWVRSRSTDVATLRKYERLRAKVEVLSSLARIQTADQPKNLDERKDLLIKNELNLLLEELENDVSEGDGTGQGRPTQFGLAQLLKPFKLGPSHGFFPWLLKVFYWGSLFLLMVMFITMVTAFVQPQFFDYHGYYDENNNWISEKVPGNWDPVAKEWIPSGVTIEEDRTNMKIGMVAFFVIQVFFCVFFWGIAKLAHRKKPPPLSPPPLGANT